MLANVVELERSAAGSPIVGAMRIGVEHLTALSRGCAVLGTGGGGEVDTSTLIARQALDDHGPVNLVTLDDLPDDGLTENPKRQKDELRDSQKAQAHRFLSAPVTRYCADPFVPLASSRPDCTLSTPKEPDRSAR